jgi:NAD(P)H-dependent FMN reductase
MKILGFVGSLRKGSYNRMLYREAIKLLPQEFEVTEGTFGHLPIFTEDIQEPMPEAVLALQKQIQAADGILLVTPEYNRSLPGAFKNMIDWTSRGALDDCWKNKKVYITGSSNGDRGANMAQYDLRRIMLYFGAQVMGTPELFLARNVEKFDANGTLVDTASKDRLQKIMTDFAAFVSRP